MVYEERQKLNVWWIWGLLFLTMFLTGLAVIMSILGAGGGSVESIIGMSIAGLSMLAVFITMAAMTMYTRIDEYGVETRLKPFATKKFFWREVESIYLEDHDNMQFGYKRNIFNRTDSLILNTGQVIVLRLRNGRKFRIGTQRPEEVEVFLEELFNSRESAAEEAIDSNLLEELQRVKLAQRR